MTYSGKCKIAFISLSCLAVAAALAVRQHYNAVALQSRQAYVSYQQRQAVQQKLVSEAAANERKLAQLRATVAQEPADLAARWRLADALQNFGMLNDALVQVKEIARRDPKSRDAAVAVANTELALHRLQRADQAYRAVTRKWPACVEGWQGLAATLYQLRRYRDAGEAGQQALRLEPKDPGSRIIVAASALEFALEYPDENETREPLHIARSLYTSMEKEDPQNGQTQYHLGLAIFLLHDKNRCLPHLKKAAELLPDRANIAYDYGQILIGMGKYSDAREFLTQAAARMPKMAGLYYLLSESYQLESDPRAIQASIQFGKQAVELSPNTPTYWDRLGAAYLKAQDVDHARRAFEKSLLLDANRSYPYQQLAGIYTRMGDAKRASIAAKMATRMIANDETMRHLEQLSEQYPGAANLLLVRADRYRDLKNYGPARDLYEQVLKLEPANAPARTAIAAIDKMHMPTDATK